MRLSLRRRLHMMHGLRLMWVWTCAKMAASSYDPACTFVRPACTRAAGIEVFTAHTHRH